MSYCQTPPRTNMANMSSFSPLLRSSPQVRVFQTSTPVFKTPMTYSPRIAGDKVQPSPSRVDLWKLELGLEEEDGVNEEEDGSNSEDDPEVDQDTKMGSCSFIEYQTIKKQLDERNAQRDDLLFRVKTLTDKNKLYRSRLEKEQNNKQQQMKIVRRTHQVALQEKVQLIQTLEDALEELEAKIAAETDKPEEVQLDANQNLKSMTQLVRHVQQLQQDKTELLNQRLTAETDLDNLRANHEEEVDACKKNLQQLQLQNKDLQEDLNKIRKLQDNKFDPHINAGDAEKKLCRLEIENDSLERQVQELNQQMAALTDSSEQDADTREKKIKEENAELKERLKFLEDEVSSKNIVLDGIEERYKDEIKQLRLDNQTSNREVRELSSKLTALQAKSPEISTRVERVEVDSVSKRVLEKAHEENVRLRAELANMRHLCKDNNAVLSLTQEKVEQLEEAVKERDELREKMVEMRTSSSDQSNELISKTEMVNELQSQVARLTEENRRIQSQLSSELDDLRRTKEAEMEVLEKEMEEKMALLDNSVHFLEDQLSVIQPAMAALRYDYAMLKKQCANMPKTIQTEVENTTREILKALSEMGGYNQELLRKYRKEMMLRKKYHNELVELKGNIRVFCRVRPPIREDGTGDQTDNVVSCDEDDDGLVCVTYKGRPQLFDLDRIFAPDASQTEVFSEVSALVTSCIDGYNVCIFAYGQTGSGKTYTMEGPSHDPGINQRALQELFQETSERSEEWDYVISVSVVEIYNEMIRDLLNNDSSYKLEVKMAAEGGYHVPGLSTVDVNSVKDVNAVFRQGHENRATACTNMNEHSSRSHALLCVTIVGTNKATGKRTTGKLNLVDLAGSERVSKSGADGTRLKEAQAINKSLACLGDVIHALRTKQSFVPYRNSKLTYLLQGSLGGDSKTLMIVQVAPVEKNVGETVASLNFAQRVRNVELGQATKKVDSVDGANETPKSKGKSKNVNGQEGSLSSTPGRTPIKSAAATTPSRYNKPRK